MVYGVKTSYVNTRTTASPREIYQIAKSLLQNANGTQHGFPNNNDLDRLDFLQCVLAVF